MVVVVRFGDDQGGRGCGEWRRRREEGRRVNAELII
jgi:hypothetical protein